MMSIDSAHPMPTRFRKAVVTLCLIVLTITSTVSAQRAAGKRPITHEDYDGWRSIMGQELSRDGKYLAYALVPQDGDGEIVVRNLETGKEWRQPRGAHSTDPLPSRLPEVPPTAPPFGGAPDFTADSRNVVFMIQPAKAETEKAKRAKKRPEEMPKDVLGIMDLSTGEVARIERVRNFKLPADGTGYVAYLLEPKPEQKAEQKPEERRPEATPPATPPARGRRPQYGSDLILRNLADKSERTFADVLEYSFSKDGKSLVFTTSSKKEETNGVYVVTPGTDAAPAALLSGKGKYSRLTWDDKNTQLAFMSDRDDAAASQPKVKLYHWDRKSPAATEIVAATTPAFRQGMVIHERGAISYSLDGGELFFGMAPAPPPEKEEGEQAANDKPVLDLWHYKDDFIQPMQRVRSDRDRERTFRAVYHIRDKKVVQLADETMDDVTPSSDGRWAIGADDRPHRLLVGVDTNYSDYYLVNTSDGSRKPLLQKQQQGWGLSFSPSGKYALYYNGKDWNSVSVPDGKVTNLTARLGGTFSNELSDMPGEAGSYGSAGWTADDKYVLLYDRYDIWQVAPDGSGAKNLTDGVGRKEKIAFRYIRLNPEERSIDPAGSLLLRAENEWTRDTGFYRDRINGGMPERIMMGPKNFSTPTKAKSADVYMLTASTFSEFPDLMVTGPDFRELKKVSDANPQKAEMSWGTAELIRYKNSDGVPLSGILFKPENFDPSKKYPMIVYIYERLSQEYHNFINPAPGSSINVSHYVSNGYLVLKPDIVYTTGHPGQSALKSVLPAIQEVADRGFLDENAIGIQGHSWGGYQIAYMVTQTNRFKAASAGAPVSNMISAYGGIRWGTGLSRQFQYEQSQSRIGAPPWESPLEFIENSPIFNANRVQTPLLMLHNDRDDAVPWYQGVEYFMALRRLGKEVYMFNYNGEYHSLRKRVNQKDYTMRMRQFFDHHLKGAPKPAWMEKGVPYLERDKEKEQYRPAPEVREKDQYRPVPQAKAKAGQ